MKKMIDEKSRERVVRLYLEGKHSVKEIMELTGVSSSQTVYRILNEYDVSGREKKKGITLSISFDKETADIIEREKPGNVSAFVCMCVKKAFSVV